MRIGIDARLWNESGVGRYIRNLVKWLGKIDKENEYVLFLRKKEFLELQFTTYNPKPKKVLADIRWHSIEEQFLLPQILNKEKLDLVHFPYFSIPVLYQKPFVVTIHDLIINHFPTGQASTLPQPIYLFKRLGHHFVLNQAVKKAKKIIVPTKATKKEILDHFKVSEEKIAVTYEGVDKNIKYPARRRYASSVAGGQISNIKTTYQKLKNLEEIKSKQYFLYVGNAYPHKNLKRLLQAFQSAISAEGGSASGGNNLKLVLVGKEDFFYKKLKDEVRKINLVNKVIFYGQANDQELSWLYQNALALILPSLMEGFGLPALEAMSCGCLVLASDTPALKEVCREVGIYFNPYNIEEIRKEISNVLNSHGEQYQEKIKKGKERAKKFSWQKMTEETLKIYNSLMTSNENQIDSNVKSVGKKKILLPNLSYKIMGVLFKVHNELGPSFLEKYYQRGIDKELKISKLKFKKEAPVEIQYKSESIGRYFLDFVIEDLIILEVKAQQYYTPKFFKQALAYLRQTNLPLAIIANFRGDKLRYKRIVNSDFKNVDLTVKDSKFESIK